jgi:hypothetical protein
MRLRFCRRFADLFYRKCRPSDAVRAKRFAAMNTSMAIGAAFSYSWSFSCLVDILKSGGNSCNNRMPQPTSGCRLKMNSLKYLTPSRSTLLRDGRGATLIESAIAFPFLILFLLVALDLVRVSYNALSLQYIVASVMREVEVGSLTEGAVAVEISKMAQAAGMEFAANGSVSLCLVENYPGSCSGVAVGNPGDLMVLAINLELDSYALSALGLLTRRTISISTQAVGKIEPD